MDPIKASNLGVNDKSGEQGAKKQGIFQSMFLAHLAKFYTRDN